MWQEEEAKVSCLWAMHEKERKDSVERGGKKKEIHHQDLREAIAQLD